MVIAIQAIGHTCSQRLDHDPYCGGPTDLLAISADGSIYDSTLDGGTSRSIERLESVIREFRFEADHLLDHITNPVIHSSALKAWAEMYVSAETLRLRRAWRVAYKRMEGLFGESFGIIDDLVAAEEEALEREESEHYAEALAGQKANQIPNRPQAIRHPRRHRRSDPQRLMNPAEVVVHVVKGQHRNVVFKLL
jgi:hypothetical protein